MAASRCENKKGSPPSLEESVLGSDVIVYAPPQLDAQVTPG